MPSVVAQLSVRRGREAIEFYKAAFGAVEEYRVGGTDEHEAVVAQLSVDGASFWVADESPEHANFSLERAVAAGAIEVYPVAEEHGWRLGRVADPYGHHWEIGRPLIAWPPARGRP
jgi:PhnB protein